MRRDADQKILLSNIRWLMDHYGKGQKPFAVMCGVASGSMNGLLNDNVTPNTKTLTKISAACGLNLWQLYIPDGARDGKGDNIYPTILRGIQEIDSDDMSFFIDFITSKINKIKSKSS